MEYRQDEEMDDAIVIGAGVVGCAIAYTLARNYEVRGTVRVLEAGSDVAEGATKANSAIVHAGFDAKPGTYKAYFNVRGNEMFEDVCRELKVPFVRNGSLVLAFSDDDRAQLEELLARGRQNGVAGLEILERDALRAREPNVSPDAVAALWAPTGGICCPYELAFHMAENAAANGVRFEFDRRVVAIYAEPGEKGWNLRTADGKRYRTRIVVNAAGVHADEISNMANFVRYRIQPRRGEYVMLDRSESGAFKSTIFQVPGPMGKGVLVSPTVDGTVIVGPTSEDVDDKSDVATTAEGMEKVVRLARRSFPALPLRKAIANFSGLRAHETTVGDFVIGGGDCRFGFINALGIESPGLTSAPAIGEALAREVAVMLHVIDDEKANPSRDVPDWPKMRELSDDARAEQVARDPAFGRIVCRCESVTEGEIRAAIRARVGARTLDGVKRRTRCGMGRCQGGFCTSRILEILSEELCRRDPANPEVELPIPMEEFLASRSKAPEGAVLRRRPRPAKAPLSRADAPDEDVDVLVVGAGPAGLAAAIAAREAGCANVLVLERDDAPGGILQQCIHNGFGLHRFKEELTGPEYAQRFIDRACELAIPVRRRAMALDVSPDRVVTTISPDGGLRRIRAKSVVLAMGCRERPRGALLIPGTRPAGVYTAGTAQRLVNMEGVMPGRRVVILGSGDIGLIMARRMTFQGAKVLACVELMPFSSGLKRNIVQCLDDFGIPLLLSHTVVDIQGKDHVAGVTVAQVGADRKPIPGTERHFDCDTLLLSVGLLPENELSKTAGVALSDVTGGPVVDDAMQTSVPGVFACGNVLHVHDLVDYVSQEAEEAGRAAAAFAAGAKGGKADVAVKDGFGVRGVVPQRVCAEGEGKVALSFRPGAVFKNATWRVRAGEDVLIARKARILTPGESQRGEIDRSLFKGHGEVVVEVVQ